MKLIDLTQMFGAGNEPTLEECKALFTEDYYPYNVGELQSVNNTTLTNNPSGEVIPLAFAGKSAGTVRDELDLVNKKYIQRVGVVDLGSLEWSLNTSGTALFTQINSMPMPCKSYPNTQYGNLLTVNYPTTTGNLASGSDNTICVINNRQIRIGIVDKSVLSGQMLYYELAEPIITDVSDVIDSFEVEGNGTIEFDSSIPVKNTIEYLRYLNEV